MGYNKVNLVDKIHCIAEIQAGLLSQNKAAEKYGTTVSVVQYWLKTKDKILAEYYSLAKGNVSGGVLKLSFGEDLDVEIIPGEAMPRKASAEDLKKENRALREKVEYLEDKVAYLEELYALINEDAMSVEKKDVLRQSRGPSAEEDGRT